MSKIVIVSVSLAVALAFACHIVTTIRKALDDKQRQADIATFRKELDRALENGNCGRAAYCRARLQELLNA